MFEGLFIWICIWTVANGDERIFVHDVTLSDRRPTSQFNARFTARSLLDCAASCNSLGACESFFYTRSLSECQLHNVVVNDATFTSPFTNLDDTAYFINYVQTPPSTPPSSPLPPIPTSPPIITTSPAATSTTSASAITSAAGTTTFAFQNVCPTALNEWKAGWDGTTFFSYSVQLIATVDKANAEMACSNRGGVLPLINTAAKMNFYRYNVSTCPYISSNSDGFWVDGHYNGANWEFSTAEPMPMGIGSFWKASGSANSTSTACVTMWEPLGNLFHDISCNGNAAIVVCETYV